MKELSPVLPNWYKISSFEELFWSFTN
jgi:hypothetical protein